VSLLLMLSSARRRNKKKHCITHKVTLPTPGPPGGVGGYEPGVLGGHGWPATPTQPGPCDGRQHGADAAQPELEAPVKPVS
jgi:hypothetical protein